MDGAGEVSLGFARTYHERGIADRNAHLHFRPMRIPVLIALLSIAHTLAGQNLDSLRSACADHSLPDSARFMACNELVWEGYMFNSPDTAWLLAERMESEARAKGKERFVAVAIEAKAAAWYVRGQFEKALGFYQQSLAIHQRLGDRNRQADVITNMAAMHSFLGAKDTALVLYEQGLRVHEELKDSASIANDLNSIGGIHMMRGDHARAVALYARSLRIQEALGDKRGAATTLSNIGAVYLAQGDYAEALKRYTTAGEAAEALNDGHLAAKVLLEIGTCQQELGDLERALSHFNRSLDLRTSLDDLHGVSTALNKIGEIQRIQGNTAAAITTFQRSASIAAEQGSPFNGGTAWMGLGNAWLDQGRNADALNAARNALPLAEEAEELSLHRDVLDLTYRALKKLGREREALAALEQSIAYNDSLMREENQREVLRHEFAYAYESQALADSLRHVEEKRAMASAHRDRRNVLVGGLAILLVLGLALWGRVRYMARANKAILAAQSKLVISERQREAEHVRNRIASDIHDDLGSDLTKLSLLGDEMRRTVADHAHATAKLANRIVELSRDATTALSDIVWAADPHQDTAHGLITRCSAYTHRMLDGTSLQQDLRFEHTGPDLMLDPGTKHDVFLLLKELVNNAVKHAGATRIEVSLTTDAKSFRLVVADDGIGFDRGSVQPGNGIRSIASRAKRIGASFAVDTSPGSGCRVSVDGQWGLPSSTMDGSE